MLVNYDSRVLIYEHIVFIRLATGPRPQSNLRKNLTIVNYDIIVVIWANL